VTLEQLRIFVSVAEREHMTRAAGDLNLTQSATSAAIAAIEERHGVKLFDRIGRRIALTAPGRAFLVEARAVLASARVAEQKLTDLAGLMAGELSLGASQTIGSYWLPRYIAEFHRRHPGVKIALRIANTREIARLASAGELDLGFVEAEIADPALDIRPIGEDELLVVAAPGLGIDMSALDASALRTRAWVAREPGSGTRAAFEAAMTDFGVPAHDLVIALELPSNEAIRAAVEAGAGLAMLSRLVVDRSLAAGSLIAAPLATPRRAFYRLRHRERWESRAARALTELIDDRHMSL
jgi:DNA-binding transcriptional LysR family regulator